MNNDDRQRTSVDDVQPIFVGNEVNIEERTNERPIECTRLVKKRRVVDSYIYERVRVREGRIRSSGTADAL